jgi:excinuclease UvrABC nuclease subunit
MAKNFSAKFSGASHKVYSFDLYNFPGEWGEVAGVYLVARLDKNNNMVCPVYVGETDNLKNRFSTHPKQACFDKNNANILGWISEGNELTRRSIETDLIDSLKPSCNDIFFC